MSVSNVFTAAGFGNGIMVGPGQSATYAVTGTFTGTLHLERLIKGGVFEEAVTIADTPINGTVVNRLDEPAQYRWRSAVATGSATASVAGVAGELVGLPDIRDPETDALLMRFRDDGIEIPALVGAHASAGATVSGTPQTTEGVGAKNGATVSVVERGNGVIHKTVLTLTATPITLTDDANVGQFGGVKIYDFPAGNILVLGAVIAAILTLVDDLWTDAAQGDVALGSGVPTDATALDGTAVDLIPETPIAAMTAQVGPIDAQSSVAGIPLASAGGTDDEANLNVRIDDAAAHITDSGLITGTVTLLWVNLGDF
jgi:hypothetical protein